MYTKNQIVEKLEKILQPNYVLAQMLDHMYGLKNSQTVLSQMIAVAEKGFRCDEDRDIMVLFHHFGEKLTSITEKTIFSYDLGEWGEDQYRSVMIFVFYCPTRDVTIPQMIAMDSGVAKTIIDKMEYFYVNPISEIKPKKT